MNRNLCKKGIVVGIIILLLGAGVIPFVTSRETLDISAFAVTDVSYDCDWIVDDEGDGDFTSIQEAIDVANENDTICVYSGAYNEHVVINKTLYIFGIDEEYLNGDDWGKPKTVGTVAIYHTSGVVFSNFVVSMSPDLGISIEYVNDSTINNCTSWTLSLTHAINNTINNSSFGTSYNADIAVHLYYSSFNKILNTYCSSGSMYGSNKIGIYLEYSDFNELINNFCSGEDVHEGDDIAIELFSSNHNKIVGNTCCTSDIGVYGDASSEWNVFYFNHFENNNKYHAFDESTNNHWNSLEKMWYPPEYVGEDDKYYDYVGNWWDDYGGIDKGNFRGATSYPIPPFILVNMDNYPIGKFIDDIHPPIVNITYPEIGHIYLPRLLSQKKSDLGPFPNLKEMEAVIIIGRQPIEIFAKDYGGSGLDTNSVKVRLNNGPWHPCTETFPHGRNKFECILNDGHLCLLCPLEVEAYDNADNREHKQMLVLFYWNIVI